MGIADRIQSTVNDVWIPAWRERLRGWAISVVDLGVQSLLKAIGSSVSKVMKPIVDELEATGEIPDALKPLFEQMKAPTGEGGAAMGMLGGSAILGGASTSALAPWFALINQQMSRKVPWQLFQPPVAFSLYFRGKMSKDDLYDMMRRAGWRDDWTETYEHVYRISFGEDHLKQLFLRGEIDEARVKTELAGQGWDDDRIAEAMKLWQIIPPLPDMVRFADFGSFDEEIISKWREFYDAPDWIREPFALLGISGEWANKYWFSHWRQPGRYELGELHRREEIDDDTVKKAYLTQGFSSFWQDKLLELVKQPWTRVDVRRMWDMRTIDETELRKAYHALGYYDEWLDGMVLWTKVYVAFPDLIMRWRNGWISLDDVRSELTGLGMPAERVEEMIQTKMEPVQAERTSGERDLTKTDIIKGVRQGVITRGEGSELLVDLGYSEDEAVYILDINIPRDEVEPVVKSRELSKADILKGLKAEVLSQAEAIAKLEELRYQPADAQFLVDIYLATIKPPKEPRDREASKADIVLAVKKGLITPENGYLMLQDIGFTPEASEFILAVRAETSPFSPISYPEFKDRTEKYRRAIGMKGKPVPSDLKDLALKLVEATAEVDQLRKALKAEEAEFEDEEIAPAESKVKLKELRLAVNRAESERVRIQGDYDSLKAQFKHSEEV